MIGAFASASPEWQSAALIFDAKRRGLKDGPKVMRNRAAAIFPTEVSANTYTVVGSAIPRAKSAMLQGSSVRMHEWTSGLLGKESSNRRAAVVSGTARDLRETERETEINYGPQSPVPLSIRQVSTVRSLPPGAIVSCLAARAAASMLHSQLLAVVDS